MDLPSWALAFVPVGLSLLHLRLATLCRQVERLEAGYWYYILLMLEA